MSTTAAAAACGGSGCTSGTRGHPESSSAISRSSVAAAFSGAEKRSMRSRHLANSAASFFSFKYTNLFFASFAYLLRSAAPISFMCRVRTTPVSRMCALISNAHSFALHPGTSHVTVSYGQRCCMSPCVP
eukprot:3505732-Rhodomonas_salina.2